MTKRDPSLYTHRVFAFLGDYVFQSRWLPENTARAMYQAACDARVFRIVGLDRRGSYSNKVEVARSYMGEGP